MKAINGKRNVKNYLQGDCIIFIPHSAAYWYDDNSLLFINWHELNQSWLLGWVAFITGSDRYISDSIWLMKLKVEK